METFTFSAQLMTFNWSPRNHFVRFWWLWHGRCSLFCRRSQFIRIKKEREKQIRISLRLSPAEENSLRVYIYAWRPSYLEWVWRWEAWASASSPLHFQQMVLSLSHVTSKKGRLQPSPTDCVCSLPHRSRVCMRQKAFVFTSLADVCLFFFFHFSLASAPEHLSRLL